MLKDIITQFFKKATIFRCIFKKQLYFVANIFDCDLLCKATDPMLSIGFLSSITCNFYNMRKFIIFILLTSDIYFKNLSITPIPVLQAAILSVYSASKNACEVSAISCSSHGFDIETSFS